MNPSSSAETKTINIASLSAGMPGLTPACGTMLAETAAVCLENNKHQVGVKLVLVGMASQTYKLVWLSVDDQKRRCYNDMQDATEWGACGVAILLVKELTGKVVIERSRKGSGFDYWLGEDDDDKLMAEKARLEVSGILAGDMTSILTRVKQKKNQIKVTDHIAPGYVGVVEFSAPTAHVEVK